MIDDLVVWPRRMNPAAGSLDETSPSLRGGRATAALTSVRRSACPPSASGHAHRAGGSPPRTAPGSARARPQRRECGRGWSRPAHRHRARSHRSGRTRAEPPAPPPGQDGKAGTTAPAAARATAPAAVCRDGPRRPQRGQQPFQPSPIDQAGDPLQPPVRPPPPAAVPSPSSPDQSDAGPAHPRCRTVSPTAIQPIKPGQAVSQGVPRSSRKAPILAKTSIEIDRVRCRRLRPSHRNTAKPERENQEVPYLLTSGGVPPPISIVPAAQSDGKRPIT